jgi:Family of unknown function (DUF6176)
MSRKSANGRLIFGILLGFLVSLPSREFEALLTRKIFAKASPPPLVVHLHRFRLQTDRLDEFNQWVNFEHEHHAATVETLEREKMYVEAIFRDRNHDPATIYWLEIRGADGAASASSPLPIDKTYNRFMQDTLVPHSRMTMEPEYILIPDFIEESISAHEVVLSQKGRQ